MMRTTKFAGFLAVLLLFSCSTKKAVNKEDARSKPEAVKQQQKERIAVLDFKTVGLPSEKSRIISELIRTDLINSNKYIVIERSQIDMIFKEHGFSSTGVTDDTSAAKIGKLLTAQKILIGNVMKLGETTVVTCRVVDVEKGVADSSAKVSADTDESLLQEVSTLVACLTGEESDSRQTETMHVKIQLKPGKKIYDVGEDIVVNYKNFPGTRYDYISIARENEPARNHYTYQYTNRQKEGSVTFYRGVNAAGTYEIRAHTNYEKGDIQHTAFCKITIK